MKIIAVGSYRHHVRIGGYAVLMDNVFAVVPYESQAWSPSSSALLAQHDLPYIGWAISPAACVGDNAFPVNGCAASGSYAATYGWTQIASALGNPVGQVKVAFIGIDNAGGSAAYLA